LFVCRLLKCAFCRRQSAGIGRPTVSRCNFLRILESNDDESSNQLIFLPFFPHDLPWEKSTDRCFSNRRNRPVEKSAEKSFVLMSQNAYGSTVTGGGHPYGLILGFLGLGGHQRRIPAFSEHFQHSHSRCWTVPVKIDFVLLRKIESQKSQHFRSRIQFHALIFSESQESYSRRAGHVYLASNSSSSSLPIVKGTADPPNT